MKRTPLRQRTPLRTRTALKRGKPLASVSKKRRPKLAARKALIASMKADGPVLCVLNLEGCTRWADDLDEIRSRARGGDIASAENCRPVCRNCHDWLGRFPAEAEVRGLTRHSWEAS